MRTYDDLVTLGEDSCRRFAVRPLFGERHDGKWVWTTYAEFQETVDAVRSGLAGLGVGPGDVVAIVAGNRVAWAAAAYATYGLEATFVPMYLEQRPDEWQYILADCKAKVVLGAGPAMTALRSMQAYLPSVEHVIGIDDDGPDSLSALIAGGRAHPVPSRHPAPEHIAGFIYTSGTTGRPKGVMLSHRNLTTNIAAATEIFPISPDDRSVSFLPWAHIYGQVVELHIILSLGASSALNDHRDRLPQDLLEVRPTILVAVPRIFNKLHASLRDQLVHKPGLVRALYRAGVRNALRAGRGEHLGVVARVVRRLADWLIFSKVRAKMGGRLRYAISASAALCRDIAETIDAIGIPVYEGYGLSETSPVVSTNRPGARKIGSVGLPVPGVRVVIDHSASPEPDQGEIIVYGPNVMRGYHHLPEQTADALTPDGGFRTGDLGRLDEDGYLWITGRLKEQYKLENGKYVMPAPLEQELARSPYIIAAMLYGANRPFNVALIVLDTAKARAWAQERGVTLGDDLTHDPHVHSLISDEIARESTEWRSYERPRAFVLLDHDFTVDDGTLTPSLKLKRATVMARFGGLLEELYAGTVPLAPTPSLASPHQEHRP